MIREEEPCFWKDPGCATAFADCPALSFQERGSLCRRCLLNTSLLCRGGCGRGQLQPTGSQLEKREHRVNLLKGLDGNSPRTRLSRVGSVEPHGSAQRGAIRGLQLACWQLPGQPLRGMTTWLVLSGYLSEMSSLFC